MPLLVSVMRHATYRLGKLGLAGVGLSMLALIYSAAVLAPLHSRSIELRNQMAELKNAKEHVPPELVKANANVERAKAFRNFFPEPNDANYWIGKLYKIAEKEKLQLPHGDYRSSETGDNFPRQLKISLPVRGSYAQIRRFAMGVLADIPFVSLDDVTFQRSDVAASSLEAQITFTLFLGKT